jgi:hypothetical integral membrane protein (TIGR02206 family)
MPPVFIPFGLSHFVVILISFLIILGVFATKKWHVKYRSILSKIIVWGGLSFYPLHFISYFFIVKSFDIRYDLPILQICGITLLSVCSFLLSKKPVWQTFFYNIVLFWGISAMLASFFTPALKEDFPHIYFWLFWLSHWAIVYILSFVLITNPKPVKYKNLWQSVAVLLAYTAVIYPFDLISNSNYAFLVTKPEIIHFGYFYSINFDQSPTYFVPALLVIVVLFHLIWGVNFLLSKLEA